MALLIVLTLTFLFSALAIGTTTVVSVEADVSARYRDGVEALYVADGALGLVLAELRPLPDWTPALQGAVHSEASRGSFMGSATLGGGTVFLCCGGRSVAERLSQEAAASPVPGRRGLPWQPYLWAPWDALVPRASPGRFFIVILLQDDEEDGDGDSGRDSNGIVVVRSEAIRADGLRRTVEALVAREPGDPDHGIPAAVRVLRWREVR
jgi:hypothetical protein